MLLEKETFSCLNPHIERFTPNTKPNSTFALTNAKSPPTEGVETMINPYLIQLALQNFVDK